ncbi:MBL fold metallo-hydrolase [Candidatus Hodarchaeum mangrovi]
MEIIPLAAESLGSRGMCVFIKTEDQKILIDPSVSLGPLRYSLKPHLKEIAAAYLSRQLILKAVKNTSIIIQTHYHGDHFTLGVNRPYEFTNQEMQNKIYGNTDKIILAKDPKKNINYNQKKRAYWLWKKKITIHSADNNQFIYGKTRIICSLPLPHGKEGSHSGWVISVFIEDSQDSVLFTSDVHGLESEAALNFILKYKSNHLILDGPSTYHPKQTEEDTRMAFNRIKRILNNQFYLDHHFLRDKNWRQILIEQNLENKALPLSSLFIKEPLCLESLRDELHDQMPMSEFGINFYTFFQEQQEKVLPIIKDQATLLPFANLEKLL